MCPFEKKLAKKKLKFNDILVLSATYASENLSDDRGQSVNHHIKKSELSQKMDMCPFENELHKYNWTCPLLKKIWMCALLKKNSVGHITF